MGYDPGGAGLHAAKLRLPRPVAELRPREPRMCSAGDAEQRYQTEMASGCIFAVSGSLRREVKLTRALKLPTMEVTGLTLIKRLALDRRRWEPYPRVLSGVPPDRNAWRRAGMVKENPGLNGGLEGGQRRAFACPAYQAYSRFGRG